MRLHNCQWMKRSKNSEEVLTPKGSMTSQHEGPFICSWPYNCLIIPWHHSSSNKHYTNGTMDHLEDNICISTEVFSHSFKLRQTQIQLTSSSHHEWISLTLTKTPVILGFTYNTKMISSGHAKNINKRRTINSIPFEHQLAQYLDKKKNPLTFSIYS